jgi:hypothetical protein
MLDRMDELGLYLMYDMRAYVIHPQETIYLLKHIIGHTPTSHQFLNK